VDTAVAADGALRVAEGGWGAGVVVGEGRNGNARALTTRGEAVLLVPRQRLGERAASLWLDFD
jgi:hypothetical protein